MCKLNIFLSSNFNWKKIGLNGLKVRKLELVDNNLYAVTNNGLFVKNINSAENFRSLGLQGKVLLDIAVFNSNHILASYRNQPDWQDTKIYETQDGGTTWNVKSTNFGIPEFPDAVNDFEWDATNNTLYATGYGVVAKSVDYGSNWEIIWGEWGVLGTFMTIHKNPYKENDLWFGGQGGFENGYLVNSFENSIREWHDLASSPNSLIKVTSDNQINQNIYAGWEGKLMKSSDNGSNWVTIINRMVEHDFFYGIGISQTNQNVLYAGKWNKGSSEQPSQPLEIFYSNNGGISWALENYSAESKGGILDLKVKSENNKDRIFVA